MKSEDLGNAEALYSAISNDLRFADAKATFVAVVIGGWIVFIEYAVKFSDLANPKKTEPIKMLLVATLACASVGLICAFLTIWPKWTCKVPGSLHIAVSLRTLNKSLAGSALVGEIRRRFEIEDDVESYAASLLTDLARIGHRCATKYTYVRIATVAGTFSIVFGTIAVIKQLY